MIKREPTTPYVPSWNYPNGPKMCPCGHHEGYHDDAGACALARWCGCAGLPATCVTPVGQLLNEDDEA